ncbi:MAG: hypothetical protein SVU32_09735 [Candidatus Nanohaloarchaea archaeon]|nr:hypothetical protein [Candidatus Nanohaloarchaea archaeon]
MTRRLLAIAGLFALLIANGGFALATNHTGNVSDAVARCEADVAEAQNAVPPDRVCTMQVQTMQCPYDSSYTHQARNGCIISELRQRGWTAATAGDSSCQADIQAAQEKAEGQMCTEQTMKLQCPNNPEVTYQAANGCEISALQERGWTQARQDVEPPTPPRREEQLEQRVKRLERQVRLLRQQVQTLTQIIKQHHPDADIEKNLSDLPKRPPMPGPPGIPDRKPENRTGPSPPELPGPGGQRGPPKGIIGRLRAFFG